MRDELKVTRRHLPHHSFTGSTYFLTFSLREGTFNREEIKLVLDHIISGDTKYYDLGGVVVMPDHVHILLTPIPGVELARIMKGIKGASANKVNKSRGTKGPLWLEESFDRIIRDHREYDEKFDYMLYNPVKRGLAPDGFLYHGAYYKGYEQTAELARKNQELMDELSKQKKQ